MEIIHLLSLFDYILVLLAILGLSLNAIAYKIVLRHIFVLKTVRFNFRMMTILCSLSILCLSSSYFLKKFHSQSQSCFKVEFIFNSIQTWTTLSTSIIVLNFYLEMKPGQNHLYKRFYFYVSLHIAAILFAFGMNCIHLLVGIKHSRTSSSTSNSTNSKMNDNDEKMTIIQNDCSIFSTSHLMIMFDILDLFNRLLIPFGIKFFFIFKSHRSLMRDKQFHSEKFMRRSIRFTSLMTTIAFGQSMAILAYFLSRLVRHVYYYHYVDTPSSAAEANKFYYSLGFFQMAEERVGNLLMLLFFCTPFLVHTILNAKFRCHLKNLIKCGEQSAASEKESTVYNIKYCQVNLNQKLLNQMKT